MKIQIAAALSIALLAGATAPAADMAGMKMSSPPAAAMEKQQVNHAVGIVKGFDAAKGTITLSHEAVPAIRWPAMTMGFRISKQLAASVKQGDRVNFEFTTKGMDAQVTKIAVAR